MSARQGMIGRRISKGRDGHQGRQLRLPGLQLGEGYLVAELCKLAGLPKPTEELAGRSVVFSPTLPGASAETAGLRPYVLLLSYDDQ